MEPPHRHHGPGGRGRRQRGVVGVALPQPHQEVGHHLLGDRVQARRPPAPAGTPGSAAGRAGTTTACWPRAPARPRGGRGRCGPPGPARRAGRPRGAQASASSSEIGVDADGLADRAVGEPPVVGVEAEREAAVVAARLLPALVGDRDDVGQRRVGQGVRRGVGHRTGHVGHAVEDRVVHRVRRVGVRGRPGVLEAAALVDGDVDQHGAGLHLRDQLVADQLGGRGAGDQHRADHHVGLHHLLLDRQLGRGEAVDPVVVAPERHPQLVEVGVEQRHVGAHPERDVGGVLAGDARRR